MESDVKRHKSSSTFLQMPYELYSEISKNFRFPKDAFSFMLSCKSFFNYFTSDIFVHGCESIMFKMKKKEKKHFKLPSFKLPFVRRLSNVGSGGNLIPILISLFNLCSNLNEVDLYLVEESGEKFINDHLHYISNIKTLKLTYTFSTTCISLLNFHKLEKLTLCQTSPRHLLDDNITHVECCKSLRELYLQRFINTRIVDRSKNFLRKVRIGRVHSICGIDFNGLKHCKHLVINGFKLNELRNTGLTSIPSIECLEVNKTFNFDLLIPFPNLKKLKLKKVEVLIGDEEDLFSEKLEKIEEYQICNCIGVKRAYADLKFVKCYPCRGFHVFCKECYDVGVRKKCK